MKKLLPLLFYFTAVSSIAAGQIIRAFTPRYYNPSVRGNIVYVANSIVSSTAIGSGVPGTAEIPPTGSSTNNSQFAIDIDIDNPAPTTKIAFGSTWNYFASTATPANDGGGNNWKSPAYTLTGVWNTGGSGSGAGKYGYNSTATTCLPSGCAPICTPPTACNKYTTYYFRKTVNFTAAELATTFASIQLNVKRDDGIVIYINGTERAANNMPAGRTYATLASSNIAVGAAEAVSFSLSPAFFIAGNNTIAVEVHTAAVQSADMSFDMEVLGIDNNGTHNSSSGNLSIPACSQILFAGLYWGAGEGSAAGSTAWITGENICKIKFPGAGAYTNITATQVDYHNPTLIPGYAHTGYKCFKDITSLMNATSPNGTYTVANVLSPLGLKDSYGGWTIVIAYANSSLTPRNLTVFDGNAAVKSGSGNVDVAISGFLTPPAGPVSCELGTVVYDGDRTSTDGFQFKQNGAALFYDMATTTIPLNGAADAWNSKVSYKGAVVAARNPAFNNTLGYDASIFDLPNTLNAQLSNNQTAATVRFFSNSENVIVQVLTTSFSQYNPTFAFDKTATDINGGALVPGDSLHYAVNFSNAGNDSSTNTVVIDNIPSGTSFIPGSLKINGVTKTDVSADDQAEYDLVNNRVVFRVGVGANAVTGGKMGIGVSGTVEFNVVTANSCAIIGCTNTVRNSARINYNGKTSGDILYDSSGVNTAGCIVKGPVVLTLSGSCHTPVDTLLTNTCPSITVLIPWRKYAGYTFYSAMPFIPANIYNPLTPVTASHIYWAYYNNGTGCSDTARIAVFIISCPDIDDDNDGIPDYVELNNPVALQDANGNGIPNWNDATYPGFTDNNADGFNDNFDPSADSDNDGIPNFYDPNFPGYIDTNGDAVNDNMDKDLDGIPNHLDLDSDNDGIPDTVESYGVDTNGDGLIDNYTDTDNDGFSQNVDANNTGVAGSSVGLGAPDFDGDGIPNYLDTDSDNDGIPDVVEAAGSYVANNGKLSNFVDANSDGLSDNNTGATALLKTGPDISPVDGRADNYPNKNLDRDFRPNAYDLDSDGDGIVDVIETGLPDANFNGIIDGTIGTDGWSNTVRSMMSLTLLNTDGAGNPDYLDIDSDDDGIPDNIEGMSTAGYLLPANTDTDGDGLADPYDNVAGYGGAGIFVYDHDSDGIPDYRDLDTDADGAPDVVEGNDWNLNGIADEDVSLTGLDTDGDGLDNRFDSLNSVTNIKGTSCKMGNGGSLAGDPVPGTKATVQNKTAGQIDRDWRFIGMILPVEIVNFSAVPEYTQVLLSWNIITSTVIDHVDIERSTGNNSFSLAGRVNDMVLLNQQQGFSFKDDISAVNATGILYYRLKFTGSAGEIKYSNVLVVKNSRTRPVVTIMPNPVTNNVAISFVAEKAGRATIRLLNSGGKTVLLQNSTAGKGSNTIMLNNLNAYSAGLYMLQVMVNDELMSQKLVLSQ